MSSHVITPGPYRATKLWNEVTRLFRAGMPLKKHRHNFRHHTSCFTATAAVDWLHQLLRNNSNFGPDVTRQQTVQLLKKFLKNHVIEDVKGRWGTEDLEDNNGLYRFPSTSTLKPIPCPLQIPGSTPGSVKKKQSFRDKDGFFKFRTNRKHEKDAQENVDPTLNTEENQAENTQHRRELTVDDEHAIWKDVTLTHLRKILGIASLDEVLDYRSVNPQNIIHNMTKVNKHGVVTLDDKTNDLPHWVLSAMKSLANWPKYDSSQPSYPGFERDVFKTVSDYFYSLPQPLLTFELYELFINVLVFSGYVAAPATLQLGKRKKPDLPSLPPPAKTSFQSTECLLLSLLRQEGCDETESPMRDVLGMKLQSQQSVFDPASLGVGDARLGGSCLNLSTTSFLRPRTRSCSLETILDDSLSQTKLFQSSDNLELSASNTKSESSTFTTPSSYTFNSTPSTSECPPEVRSRKRLSLGSMKGLRSAQRMRPLRPRSMGSCLDIVVETGEEEAKESGFSTRAASCLDVNTSAAQLPPFLPSCPAFPSSALAKTYESCATGPQPAASTSNLQTPRAPTFTRRCISSLDLSKPPHPQSLFKRPKPKPQNSLLQPQCERVAIEALQLCTLLLPPSSRRKLQLLMRMISRISQNVDMPRLHPAIGTRTLMVHTFSGCVLGSAEEGDLDELLATRLVSFFMDHQQSILSVPEYLLTAIGDHIQYLRTVQVPVGVEVEGDEEVCAPLPIYAFCRQISGAEFEQQKVDFLQQAMEELLETLLTDQNISEKDRRKKLKQFQKQYPDIYSRHVPPADQKNKPKIKPPLLNIKKTKVFSIRN
ncbi:hypothetical protein WMY93_025400 [Mugilogobius chulae]|uniref:DEP domain-containing protein n=1 Tax=Mugilogobius chulae TaxID=88201 RepID=A0AAW0N2E8_9GOBI